MAHKYAAQGTENSARAVGRSLPISTKYSVETLSMIRNKKVASAKKMLAAVIAKKRAVALKRYYEEVPHKKGMAAGAYPEKCCKFILKVIKSAEANAQFKGLNTANLVIIHAAAHRGPTTPRHGRHRGNAKKTHIEIILTEGAAKKQEKKEKKKISKTKTIKTEITTKAEKKEAVKKEKTEVKENKEAATKLKDGLKTHMDKSTLDGLGKTTESPKTNSTNNAEEKK